MIRSVTDRSNHMLNALCYQGPSRIKKAWLGALACYTHTRSYDGAVINDAGDTISFGRWYSFKAAVQIGWEWLWRKN